MISKTKSHDTLAVEKLLFWGILLSYSYFFSAGEWNQISRYNLIFTLVEPHTVEAPLFSIDRFIESPKHNFNTGDWAIHNGHYYSNKAPGSALLAAPFYALLYFIEVTFFNIMPQDPLITIFNAWLINIFVSILPMALSAVCFFRINLRQNNDVKKSLILTLLCYFSTLLFPYSSSLWGLTTCSAFLIIALYNLLVSPSRQSNLVLGLTLGLAVLTEYIAIVVVLAIGIFFFRRIKLHRLLQILLGALLPLLLYLFYHWTCFETPWLPATFFNNPEFKEQTKAYGQFAGIDLQALLGLLISNRYGIFVHMPFLLLSLFGFWKWHKSRNDQALMWTLFSSIIIFLLINASFHGWHGGFVVGARYQIPVIPFYVLGLNFLPNKIRYTNLLSLLGVFSFVNMLVINSVTPIYVIKNSQHLGLYEYYLRFIASDIATRTYHVRLTFPDYKPIQDMHTFNFGELMSLQGLSTLIPFYLLTFLLLLLLRKILRENFS